MATVHSLCYCISLEKWRSFECKSETEHQPVHEILETFQETECPNRVGIQKTYLSALAKLEISVKQYVDILEHLDCTPIQSIFYFIHDNYLLIFFQVALTLFFSFFNLISSFSYERK